MWDFIFALEDWWECFNFSPLHLAFKTIEKEKKIVWYEWILGF
jgi:hypothetical protein